MEHELNSVSSVKRLHSFVKMMEQVKCSESLVEKVNNLESSMEQVSNSNNSVRCLDSLDYLM